MTEKLRPCLAELVGTFIFFFIGAGSIVADSYTHGGVGLIGVALAHGLILSIMVSSFGAISGGHFNPAVSVGAWVARKIDRATTICYIISQLIGGTLAGYLLKIVFPEAAWQAVHLGTPTLAVGVSPAVGLILEATLTFFLMIAVLATAIDKAAPKIGGFGIGLTLAVDILVGGPVTGAAANPARVFCTALPAGSWDYHWIYWVGPITGAAFASWLYTRFISKTI
jgi:MIP family channel proteins